jgi:hypothetical protein
VIVNTEFEAAPAAAISRNAERAAELAALRRDFPRYEFEIHVLAGQDHYTARRRPGLPDVQPYSVTSADLDRIRRELAAGTEGGGAAAGSARPAQ